MLLRTTSSVLAVLALTTPVLADVTPAEVWQNWVDYYKANGYAVTEGSRDEAGETLSLKDVAISFAAPDDASKVNITVPEITLTGTGDGKVRTTMATTMPSTITFKDDEGDRVTLTGSVGMKDAEIVTSGSVGDMTHETRAAEMTAALATVSVEGEGEKPFPVTLTLRNYTSTQHVVDGATMAIDGTLAADRLELTGAFDDSTGEKPGKVSFTGAVDGLKSSGKGAMPKGVDIAKDLNAGLKAGLNMEGTFSVGAGEFTFDYAGKDDDGADQTGKGKGTFAGFEMTGGFSDKGLKYQGSSDGSSFEMTASDLPFPFSYAVDQSTFDVQMPVMKSDTAQPMKIAYSLAGLTVADGIWDLFDAGKALPRDPASFDVDVTGMVKLTADLFDPANMKKIEEAGAAEEAAMAGTDTAATEPADTGAAAEAAADAAADAAATDANAAGADGADTTAADAATTEAPAADAPADEAKAEDTTAADATPATDTAATDAATDAAADGADATTDGATDAADDAAEPEMPVELTELTINKLALAVVGAKLDASGALTVPEGGSFDSPVGKISARLDGVNGLIDKLVAAGLVPEDQVAGARMMLAMFAKPAPEGGDALVSEFEFKEGGQVFANGQQVK